MEKKDRDYSNDEITVHWRPDKCVHATICYAKLRSVFDPGRRPWIRLDKGTTEEIIDIVNQCPTDALTYTRLKEPQKEEEKKNEEPKKELENNEVKEPATKIQIMKDGPALISGDFVLKDIHGLKISTANNIALCRCGKSSTQCNIIG
ncbi:MAG: hypothetical protein C0597_16370, partial [Marinilabiliales bacterium]